MSRPIDADALHKAFDDAMRNCASSRLSKAVIHSVIENATTLETKHGKWLRPKDIYIPQCSYKYWCSACKGIAYYNHGQNAKKIKAGRPKCEYKFCPWCGADMRGEER